VRVQVNDVDRHLLERRLAGRDHDPPGPVDHALEDDPVGGLASA
jgi:hypothetical protein